MESVFSSIKEFMQTIFGVYSPVTYTDSLGNVIVPSGLAGVDIPYLLSVCLFGLVVYSLFRLLGGFLK